MGTAAGRGPGAGGKASNSFALRSFSRFRWMAATRSRTERATGW